MTYDIRHRIGVLGAPAAEVHAQLATIDGLRQWWTEDTTGDTAVGGTVRFAFGAPDRYMSMQVTDDVAGERVAWRCVDGPPEWIGTDITFDLRPAAGETLVLFTHSGWREPVEFMSHCSSKWGSYLLSMKHGLESGAARPFPRDVKMSSFD